MYVYLNNFILLCCLCSVCICVLILLKFTVSHLSFSYILLVFIYIVHCTVCVSVCPVLYVFLCIPKYLCVVFPVSYMCVFVCVSVQYILNKQSLDMFSLIGNESVSMRGDRLPS